MVDLKVRRSLYHCCCLACQNHPKGAWLSTTKPLTASWPCWMNGNGDCSQGSWPCGEAMAESWRWLRLLGSIARQFDAAWRNCGVALARPHGAFANREGVVGSWKKRTYAGEAIAGVGRGDHGWR